jgi:Cellulose binding domain
MRLQPLSRRPRSAPRRHRALVCAALVVTLVLAVGNYLVTYLIQSQWADGFVALLTIRNSGSTAVDGWTQTGRSVSASSNADWNRVIPAGGPYRLGFQASFSGTNINPTAFTLNGRACTTA